jgi:hypothetical protein
MAILRWVEQLHRQALVDLKGDERMSSVPDCFKAYEEGKHRRYNLLFGVNGGAFAVAKFFADRGVAPIFGRLSLAQLAQNPGLSSSDIGSLKYLRGCLQEAMRLWPTTAMLARLILADDRLAGVTVPAKTQVIILNNFLHRDSETQPFADRFSPEQWLETETNYYFNHLSNGRRVCAGKYIALFLGPAVLAEFLRTCRYILLQPMLDSSKPLPHALNEFRIKLERVLMCTDVRELPSLQPMAITISDLLKMSQSQLDNLFTQSPTGEFPDGEAKGTAIIAPGTTYTVEIAELINYFAWKGKVFDSQKGLLRNEILPFGIRAIIAKIYKAPSWLDGKECIVLDYSETSILAHWIRDEIRNIAPGMYLGKVYWSKKRLIDFVLEFKE